MHPNYPYFGSSNMYYYPIKPIPNPYYRHQGMHYNARSLSRQQPIAGRATWTEGGAVTKCGKPWSTNEYMTAAVGENAPYECGQSLKIQNPAIPGREIIVTVVDKVPGYPSNEINLHRRAFAALGVDPSVGIMNVTIIPEPELEEEKWGKYLVEVIQTAYPNYNVTEYNAVDKIEDSPSQTRETFEFILQSDGETMKLQGNVVYNPTTDRVISFDFKEIS